MATTKIITEVTDLNAASSTNGLKMPSGAAYSGTPTDGMVRNSSETGSQGSANVMQHFNGTDWKNYENLPNTFTVDFLVVAGGGGAGGGGGGGGGGGLLTTTTYGGSESVFLASPAAPYTVSVGPGGAGGNGSTRAIGSSGVDSSFSTITATGGGAGAGAFDNVSSTMNGGSGGGGANSSGAGNYIDGGDGTSGQGFDGGRGYRTNLSYNAAGGGGGAGGAGADGSGTGSSPVAGAGGIGLSNLITGTSVTYSAGGVGAAEIGSSSSAPNSAPNTANGGNQVNNAAMNQTGGSGGSGVVILRCTKATATLGSGITVNGTAGPGSVNGVAISGTSDYYYSATLGTGTITFS